MILIDVGNIKIEKVTKSIGNLLDKEEKSWME